MIYKQPFALLQAFTTLSVFSLVVFLWIFLIRFLNRNYEIICHLTHINFWTSKIEPHNQLLRIVITYQHISVLLIKILH